MDIEEDNRDNRNEHILEGIMDFKEKFLDNAIENFFKHGDFEKINSFPKRKLLF